MTFNLAEKLDEYAEELGLEKSLAEAIENAENKDIPYLLKRIAEEPQTEIERSIYIEQLSKKTGVAKRSINADLKRLMPLPSNEEGKVEKTALFEGLIDIVTDDDDQVTFLVKEGDLLITKREHCSNDKPCVIPPEKKQLPFDLIRSKEIIKYYENDNHQKLFEDIIIYLQRFSFATDDQFLLLACFVFLTYLQDNPSIKNLPTIYFYAAPERGKTRTGKSMTYICYRGIHTIDLRETNIFRFSDRFQSTLFFDIMDLWKQIERNNSQDIILLRNERGASVPRVLNPEKGPFDDMTIFKIFGPTIIASNKDIHTILDTRCIPIDMPNKPDYYENPSPEKAANIKARLIAWRARCLFEPLSEIDVVPEITGRLWEISKPLLQICRMLCPKRYDELVATITSIAKNKKVEKSESFEAKIIGVIRELFIEATCSESGTFATIPTSEVLQQINSGLKSDFQISSQGFGRKLKAIGIKTTIIGGYSKIEIDKKTLDEFIKQYGLENRFQKRTLDDVLNSFR
ncbi:MAG TPA: hypothetical protein PKZ86_00290 [Smithella sp.]|nr:hypothetical protein [Smithella sp.]HQH15544.1 hypothetical protein [Smithella sp.]